MLPATGDIPRRARRPRKEQISGDMLWLLVPGALTVYLAFNAGGFFADTPAIVAALLAVLLILRVTLAEHPFRGFSATGGVAIAALVLFAIWSLASAIWSHAAGRALLEFDRALMYLLVLVLFNAFLREPGRIRWMLRGVALGMAIVGTAALVSRVLPHVLTTSTPLAAARLAYPLTYWNALGIFASLGAVFGFHLAADENEPAVVRVLGALAVPVLATTVYFTLSRGGIAAGILALGLYILLARPRGLVSALVAIVPAGVIAVITAYHAALLVKTPLTTPAALAQGRHVALVVALCAVGAAVLRTLLIPLDNWARRVQVSARARISAAGIAGVAVVAAVIVALALQVPAGIAHQFHRFVHGSNASYQRDLRQRLTDPTNNGRIALWRVAVHEWERHPVRGEGAGTFENRWARDRPAAEQSVHVHSLYVQTLDELGLVGLVLIVTALVAILFGLARRARGENRALYAVLLAAGFAWALHAGIDWDWEMPAVGLWFFALGGAGLAAARRRGQRRTAPVLGRTLRVALGLGFALLAIMPVAIFVSQRRLDNAVRAFRAGNCRRAVGDALGSISAVSARPEPYEVLGYCDARLGGGPLAVAALKAAVVRDPDNWRVHYELALVRGASGLDPRPEAEEALRLDPKGNLTQGVAADFAHTNNARRWNAIARGEPLPIG